MNADRHRYDNARGRCHDAWPGHGGQGLPAERTGLPLKHRFLPTRSWRLIETRNGSDATLSRYVRGGRYIDDLVQVAVNTTPAADDTCDASYTAMQNANFNVIGLADANGTLAERYEYSAYGQRTVYTKPGDNDALTAAPLYHSAAVTDASGAAHPHTLNPFGHQGLYHDKEFALVQNRRRYLDPITGRFTQRDPAGYVDGMGLYAWCGNRPIILTDPFGERGGLTGQQDAEMAQKYGYWGVLGYHFGAVLWGDLSSGKTGARMAGYVDGYLGALNPLGGGPGFDKLAERVSPGSVTAQDEAEYASGKEGGAVYGYVANAGAVLTAITSLPKALAEVKRLGGLSAILRTLQTPNGVKLVFGSGEAVLVSAEVAGKLGVVTAGTLNAMDLKNDVTVDGTSRTEGSSSGSDRPPLKRIHSDETITRGNKCSYDYWKKQSTQDIVESLRPGAKQPLRVKSDGRIYQGNTRIKVLEERGYDVNALPRVPVD